MAMNVTQWLERRVAERLVMFLLAIAALAIGWVGLRERGPELTFDLTAASNVLDVHEDVPQLDVVFEGEDIRQSRQNLLVWVVRVANTGRSHVLQGHYDSNEPWGFSLTTGRIVEARVRSATSEYLERNAVPRVVRDQQVELPRVILDAGQSFVVQLLILHPEIEHPRLVPFGKVAGVDEIRVVHTVEDQTDRGLIAEAFQGRWSVQAVRWLGMVGGTLLAFGVFGTGIGLAGVTFEGASRKRRERRLPFLLSKSGVDDKYRDFIGEQYVRSGAGDLRYLLSTLHDEEALQSALFRRRALRGFLRGKREGRRASLIHEDPRMAEALLRGTGTHFRLFAMIKQLEILGAVEKEEEGVHVDPVLIDNLETFIALI